MSSSTDAPRPRIGGRRVLACVLVLCAGWMPVLAAPAGASPLPVVDLVCIGAGQFDFARPLNNNTVPASISALIGSCTSPSGRAGGIRSSVLFGTDSVAHGCSPVGLSIDGTGTLSWSDGTTTNFSLQVSTDLAKPPVGFGAQFTAGPLAGDRLFGIPLLIVQNGLCGFGGVRSLDFPLVLILVTGPG